MKLKWLLALLLASQLWAQQPITNGQPAITTASLTSTTCPGTGCVAVATTGYAVASVTVHGTYAGSTLNFEFSDDGGTTYYANTCTRTDSAVQETSEAVTTNATRAWDCGVYAATNFRVRQSAIGSGTAVIGITLSSAPIEPAQTVSVAGTPSVNATPVAPAAGTYVGDTATTTTATTTNSALGCYVQSGTGTTASTNATNCKASAGNFYGVRAVNTTATVAYVRMYNAASGPTCSSATGFIETIPVPANASGAGFAFMTTVPIGYSTGIGFCVTGGGGNTDNTNAVAGVYITVYYK